MVKEMMQRLIELNEKRKNKLREEEILKRCGCICYCPECHDALNDQADCEDADNVKYECNCGEVSEWDFDIAPVPILMSKNKKSTTKG